MQPRLAWVLGDPAGIGPEIVAKSLASPETRARCRPVLVGPSWLLRRGEAVARCQVPVTVCPAPALDSLPPDALPLVEAGGPERPFPYGQVSPEAGRLCLDTLRAAVELARAKVVDGVVFGPLNKEALSRGGNPYRDELHLLAEWLGDSEVGEINAAAGLFTTRVTSHLPLKEVAAALRPEKILWAARTLHQLLREAGSPSATVAVAALNPHGGEHGLCGTEELEMIEPAVRRAQAEGIPAVGPYPADTIFLRATRGEFQGVVTMYHDQGQIATKLLGFDRGVTVQGGLRVVITTPAHGTAFDIAGRGVASPEAFQAAVALAARLAAARRPAGA